jgi:hypothetical protein
MKNLKVWQKLVLMGLVFLIPFAVVTFKLISSVNTLGIDFARKELVGLKYLSPLRNLLQHTQQHRSLTHASLLGNRGVESQFLAARNEIKTAITEVDKADSLFSTELETNDQWKSIKEDAGNANGKCPNSFGKAEF